MRIIGPLPTPKTYRPPSPVRATPRPAAAPPCCPRVTITLPAGRPAALAATDAARTPAYVFGVGHNFNVLTHFTSKDQECPAHRDRFGLVPVIVKPGAFDASIRAVRQGRGAVRLLVAHDDTRQLLSTDDPSFEVWAGDGSLYWSIRPVTADGRTAVRFIAESPDLRQCSVGYTGFDLAESFNGAFYRARVMDLAEISIVTEGANPGTRVRVAY